MKQTPLKRRAWMRSRADSYSRGMREVDPARQAWKCPRYGRCQNCGLIDDRPLHGHHVIERQAFVRAGLDEWDLRNRMNLCERCHFEHTYGQANRKIPVEKIPEVALAYAVSVLGEPFVSDHVRRHYGCEVTL